MDEPSSKAVNDVDVGTASHDTSRATRMYDAALPGRFCPAWFHIAMRGVLGSWKPDFSKLRIARCYVDKFLKLKYFFLLCRTELS